MNDYFTPEPFCPGGHTRPRRKPRTRADGIEYLTRHFRYDVMNSWNNSTSYAVNVKVNRLQWPDSASADRAYDFAGRPGIDVQYARPLNAFDTSYHHRWQIGQNGRSGGYFVLVQGGSEDSDYRSYCTVCGQGNACTVLPAPETPEARLKAYVVEHNTWIPEVYPAQSEVHALGLEPEQVIQLVKTWRKSGELRWVSASNRCGSCGALARQNYVTPPLRVWANGKSTDQYEDFAEWDREEVLRRVNLVWEFDQAVEAACLLFREYVCAHRLKERSVKVRQTIHEVVPV